MFSNSAVVLQIPYPTFKYYNTIQYNTIQYSVQWWPEGGGWLCSGEVDSAQVSLESFSEDSERLCGPESGRELVPKTKKSFNFAERPLIALSDSGTRRPAEVVERRDRAGVCGFSNAWR